MTELDRDELQATELMERNQLGINRCFIVNGAKFRRSCSSCHGAVKYFRNTVIKDWNGKYVCNTCSRPVETVAVRNVK